MIRNLKQKLRAVRNETGSGTFITILMLVPLLCGLVGVAMDYSYATYMRNSLQASLDNATAGAASSLARVDNGNTAYFSGGPADVTKAIKSSYDADRTNHPALKNEEYTLEGSLAAREVFRGRAATPVVEAIAHESTDTFFLHYFGINSFEYDIKSEARLGFDVDNKAVNG